MQIICSLTFIQTNQACMPVHADLIQFNAEEMNIFIDAFLAGDIYGHQYCKSSYEKNIPHWH